MNETPEVPGPPGEDAGDRQDHWPYERPTQQAPSDVPPLDDVDDPGRRRLRGSRLVAASVAVVVLFGGGLALARSGGDGGDGGSDGVATVDGSSGDRASTGDEGGGGGRPDPAEMQDAMLDYARCMRDHGIDMPDPEFSDDGRGMVIRGGPAGGRTTGGPAPESDEFQAADDECNDILEEIRGEMPRPSPEEIAEMQDKLVAMAECMRAKGHDMPDPQVSDDGGVKIEMHAGPDSGPAGIGDPRNEQFQEDQQACNDEAGLDSGPMTNAPGSAGSGSGASTT